MYGRSALLLPGGYSGVIQMQAIDCTLSSLIRHGAFLWTSYESAQPVVLKHIMASTGVLSNKRWRTGCRHFS